MKCVVKNTTSPGLTDTTFFTLCFGHVFFKVGVRVIVGVTEFKAEFTGMLNLHERSDFIYVVVCFVKPV